MKKSVVPALILAHRLPVCQLSWRLSTEIHFTWDHLNEKINLSLVRTENSKSEVGGAAKSGAWGELEDPKLSPPTRNSGQGEGGYHWGGLSASPLLPRRSPF